VARALAFTVLVLSNLALIQVNRSWATSGGVPRARNAALWWIASVTVVLLATVLWVPAIAALFAFRAPSATMLAIGTGLCLIAFAWFEAAKRFAGNYTR